MSVNTIGWRKNVFYLITIFVTVGGVMAFLGSSVLIYYILKEDGSKSTETKPILKDNVSAKPSASLSEKFDKKKVVYTQENTLKHKYTLENALAQCKRVGNTCWINVTFQILSSRPSFEFFTKNIFTKNTMAYYIREALIARHFGGIMNLNSYYSRILSLCGMNIDTNEMGDVNELLISILEKVSEDLKAEARNKKESSKFLLSRFHEIFTMEITKKGNRRSFNEFCFLDDYNDYKDIKDFESNVKKIGKLHSFVSYSNSFPVISRNSNSSRTPTIFGQNIEENLTILGKSYKCVLIVGYKEAHYVSIIRYDSKWYCVNDDNVEEIESLEAFLKNPNYRYAFNLLLFEQV